MSSSSTVAGTRRGQYPLLDCPDCHVPLIRIQSKQEQSLNKWFVKCPNNIKGDSTTCGWIRSEEQYEVWAKSEQKKQANPIYLQGPLDSVSADGINDVKQQLGEVKQTLDSVITELWKLRNQIGGSHSVDPCQSSEPRHDLGNRKMQIVLDVSVLVGVLVGVLLGVVAAQLMK